jgi:hypothetical protein
MNVHFATAMHSRRQEMRTAEAQWRKTRPRRLDFLDLPPPATFGGALFARLGAWIADHFVALYLVTLTAAFVAGCLTGRLV